MKHKTALVTGASRGIGKAIATSLAKKGFDLAITCVKNKEKLEDVKSIIESFGVRCISELCDVSDPNAVENLFHLISSEYEGIDVLVNNAGISHIGLLTDMSIEEWQRVINTNLNSVFYCCKHVIPYMLHKKEGRIINISSVWGEVGASCEVAYSAAKGGMNSYTKALAKELAPSNIQVNAISCGAIDTEMNQFLSVEDRIAITDDIPASRFGKVEEVADLVCQLVEAPSYLTGHILRMDGGWI